jgi:hypothetical protein
MVSQLINNPAFRNSITLLIAFFLSVWALAEEKEMLAKDSVDFSGQAIAWLNYNFKNEPHAQLGMRYLPDLYFSHSLKANRKIDFEASANAYASLSSIPFDSISYNGEIKPYRLWARYSTPQLEVRLGLQKINFGSANMLRPLMWFDRVDARDPLKLTDGVWGALGRYYFLNNANLWLWCLYGNDKTSPWDIGKTSNDFPEAGGRFQFPLPHTEVAFTYHYRQVDTRDIGIGVTAYEDLPENRIGLDVRYDGVIGLWCEAALIHKNRETGTLTNQKIVNLGADYTFGIGNGLYVMAEQLLFSTDEKTFDFSQPYYFTAVNVNYPLGIADNLNAIIYYDWKNKNAYRFVNWSHTKGNFTFYAMTFWNPDSYSLPVEGGGSSLFAGPGVQLMLVYNH